MITNQGAPTADNWRWARRSYQPEGANAVHALAEAMVHGLIGRFEARYAIMPLLAEFRHKLPATNASATTGGACADPARAATAIARSPIAGSRYNDRHRLLGHKRAVRMALRAGLQGRASGD